MKGKKWQAEWSTYKDRHSGTNVMRLTNYFGHHHHLYFTNPGWYANGTKMLMGGDRDNRTNLFSIDLVSGEITQLTDYEPLAVPYEVQFLEACVNPLKDEAYYWYGCKLMALDLVTLAERVLWDAPEGYLKTMTNVTSDGKYILGGRMRDMSDVIETDLLHGYIGFAELWAAHPHSYIFKTPVDGGETKIVHEEHCWIGHVNTSPTMPNIASFCHEGRWEDVDNRIWCIDHETGRAWKLRERTVPRERVGHEYWYADGVTIGYHGDNPVTNKKFFGHVRFDNTDNHEADFPFVTGHIHSNDKHLVVGDGGRFIRVWRYDEKTNTYDGPRALCLHNSSMHQQCVHAHPRFTPDGKKVVFSSDQTGYGSPYFVDVPDFDSLPLIEE